MSCKRVTLVAMFFAIFQFSRVEGSGLVEMISDYAKVAKNAEKPTTEIHQNFSPSSTLPPENLTEPIPDYEDFDDLQEQDRSLDRNSSTETMMKYFNGIVSLLALMYKFNGKFGGAKPSGLHFHNRNEPREKESRKGADRLRETGKRFQDRFEFPQKKFKYGGNAADNMIDQQFQPVENYPPYNPLKANSAESYDQEDKKTSYDSDSMQYDLTKNSQSDSDPDFDIQQSYSYEIPYESSKPGYDLASDAWSHHQDDLRPVYRPWMTKTPGEDQPSDGGDSYLPWNAKIPTEEKPSPDGDSYQPWKTKTPPAAEGKPADGDSDPRRPWKGKPSGEDFPVYHHDFHNPPPPDHHFEYHEMDHPVDEDRVSKKPYSYYFLGRKLWYIPLLFSVYFIIYIGALVLKSVARHKIQFPDKLWNLHEDQFGHGKHRRHRKIDEITENYEKAVDNVKNKFM